MYEEVNQRITRMLSMSVGTTCTGACLYTVSLHTSLNYSQFTTPAHIDAAQIDT